MRKTRGLLFILVGLILAGLSGYAVLSYTKQASAKAAESVSICPASASKVSDPDHQPPTASTIMNTEIRPKVARSRASPAPAPCW